MMLIPFVFAGLLSIPNLVAGIQPPKASVSLAGKGRDDSDGDDWDVLRTPRRHLQPLSVSGLIHLYTADSQNANDSIGSAAGTLGTTTKFARRDFFGFAFDFDGTRSAVVTLPVNINSLVFPKLTSKF